MGFNKSSMVRIVGGPHKYYTEYTTTNLYVEKAFGGNIHDITITNDSSSDTIQVSFNGATNKGDIKAGESMTYNVKTATSVYIKGTAGGDKVRIWGW